MALRRIRLTVSLDIEDADDVTAKAHALQLMKASEPIQAKLRIVNWQLESVHTRKRR